MLIDIDLDDAENNDAHEKGMSHKYYPCFRLNFFTGKKKRTTIASLTDVDADGFSTDLDDTENNNAHEKGTNHKYYLSFLSQYFYRQERTRYDW